MLNRKLVEEEFGFMGGSIFLNVSSVVMPPKRVQDGYRGFMDSYVENFGADIVPRAWAIVNEARPKLAKLINAERAHEIAFVKNTCEGISIIADGYPLGAGDNVVVVDQEHQANLFPWINVHQRKGVQLKVAKSKNSEVDADDVLALIDDKTRIVAISAVQFSTGFLADLHKLGAECHRRGVVFVVDGIQAMGRLKLDVQAMHIDWLVAGSNKGLLGSLGAGMVYCSDRIVQKIIPPYASYQSVVSHVTPPAITTNFETLEWYPNARRFESGNLSYNCILAISLGVDLLLELGIDNIETQVRLLEEHLRSLMTDLQLAVVCPASPANRSGLVIIYYPIEHEDEVVRILESYRIYATMRGGYIRLGINFYNTIEQMKTVSEALHKIDALKNIKK